jgi:hypothetical protein
MNPASLRKRYNDQQDGDFVLNVIKLSQLKKYVHWSF